MRKLSGQVEADAFVSFVQAERLMLHCNMNATFISLQNGLEDILGDLRFARRSGDLGRLALLAYCEVRRWAREAGEEELARHSTELINNCPYAGRDEFLTAVDGLIVELEHTRVSAAHFAPAVQA